jgi:hypothetical protein
MAPASIADALKTMSELIAGLEDAYWEAATVETKDLFFDLISALNVEISELAKLSIQDHHLEYEPVTLEFKRARTRLTDLRKILDERVARSATAARLEVLISDVVGLVAH